MNKDLKVALIVFGSLFGLLAIALIGAITFFSMSIGHQMQNAAKNGAASAAKIAKFTLPPGYRYGMGMDMAFLNMVMIEPAKPRTSFLIELEGVSVAADSSDKAQMDRAMEQGLGGQCLDRKDMGSDDLKTATGKTVTLRVIDCRNIAGQDRVAEYGTIPSSYPLAMLIAIGPPATFDRDAVRSIIRSIH